MRNILKIALVIIAIFVVALLVLYFIFMSAIQFDSNSKVSSFLIEFNDLKEKVYISANVWGLTGDHEMIVLSSTPINNPTSSIDKEMYYIFYTSEVYYKKIGNDTLVVYAPSSSISLPSKKIFNSIKIVLNELQDYDQVRDYRFNYKNYKLSKISAYDD
jgi:hypothetical protein